ncbi:hypothetical protein [Psychrobacillus sp. OK032]|uniref:hypothetical protein n=1 Tax=Psychrobacillus sp. OK032 TaxID=1884358 RepID=UPI0008AD0069|nr:hypothetical protein [Psychrobacillus sp. OK032]SER53190.1 hypothetical protein SAMN05518872_10181 [Psychrobacillus sp. OK032]
MVGTILSNFWVALIAFSAYFFSSYPFLNGKRILWDASMLALLFFFLTFIARAIIAFVMVNPVATEEEMAFATQKEIDAVEPSSEELAKIVKSMLSEQ